MAYSERNRKIAWRYWRSYYRIDSGVVVPPPPPPPCVLLRLAHVINFISARNFDIFILCYFKTSKMKCSCLFWLQCGGWVLISCYSAVWTFVTSCLVSASQYKTDRTDDWFPKNFIIEIGREKVINLKKFFPTKCFYWYICLNLSDSLWSLTPGRWRLGLVLTMGRKHSRLCLAPKRRSVS